MPRDLHFYNGIRDTWNESMMMLPRETGLELAKVVHCSINIHGDFAGNSMRIKFYSQSCMMWSLLVMQQNLKLPTSLMKIY